MKNTEIRMAMIMNGVRQYQIAPRYGLNESNFSRLLRDELPQEKKDRILSIINELSKERVAQ